jgi:5-methyltetrahydrofolate--homocysteine methyltransferase
MLEVNNFEVHDLGVDVPAPTFVAKIGEVRPDIVGMSGFLTLAFDEMKHTVDAIVEAGLRDKVKIMIAVRSWTTTWPGMSAPIPTVPMPSTAVKLAKSWTGGI